MKKRKISKIKGKRQYKSVHNFDQTLADKVCAQLAMGKSLHSVCKQAGMPSAVAIFHWIHKFPDFMRQYTLAKMEATDALVEEMLDIADDGTNDFMEIVKGDKAYTVENKEFVNRSRLRIDTRKWIASKLKPKKYSDRVDITSDGERMNFIPIATVIKPIPKVNSPADIDASADTAVIPVSDPTVSESEA